MQTVRAVNSVVMDDEILSQIDSGPSPPVALTRTKSVRGVATGSVPAEEKKSELGLNMRYGDVVSLRSDVDDLQG